MIFSQDLQLALCEEFELECCANLAQAITRHVNDAKAIRERGGEEWWKLHEAAMLALGSGQEVIETQVKAGHVPFDISGFMTAVVLQDLNSLLHPFLLGRCLWVASKFSAHLQQQTITSFLEGTAGQEQAVPVRISAVRAVGLRVPPEQTCPHPGLHPQRLRG